MMTGIATYQSVSMHTDVGQIYLEVDEVFNIALCPRLFSAKRLDDFEKEAAVDLKNAIVATFQVVVAVCHRHLCLLIQLTTAAAMLMIY